MKKVTNRCLALLFSLLFSVSFGQNPDSLKMVDRSLLPDTSLIPKDTTELKPWEIIYADTLAADSVIKEPKLNILDSLRLYFLSDRFDLSDQFIRSYGHDAGDFVKSNPSVFCIDYQPIPLRKTVAPFALPGNRLDFILGDRAIHPVEHLPEPDNQIGLDEVPTAAVQKIYNIEGPLGKIFGGDNATASLILLPVRPKSSRAESELVVDVGDLGYANTKAVFTERKRSGRLIQLAAEYRKSDGFDYNWGDSTYHHWADLIYPINDKLNLNLNGRLYRRRGNILLRLNSKFVRNRRDRDFSAGLDYSFSAYHRSSLGVRHQRSETEIDIAQRAYKRDIDIIDNSIYYSHNAIIGKYKMRYELFFTEEEYHNFDYFLKRHRARLNSTIFRGDSVCAVVGNFGFEKIGGFNPAPSLVLAYKKEKESFYLSLSAGYVTKFPRQYELDLTPAIDRFIDGAVNDYYESGNVYLQPEKQLSGNLTMAFGKKNNDLTVSLSGGKIFDGIDWNQSTKDTSGLSLTAFQADNRDIEYASLSITKKLSLGEKLFWTSGGSYRYISINGNDSPPYAPDYQAHTGFELYHYIKLLELHLYGYIETGYVGPYHSYPAFGDEAEELGNKFVTNLKLSFRIKSFRFYYYWQNLFFAEYQNRDDYGIRDRLIYYGFTWHFLD